MDDLSSSVTKGMRGVYHLVLYVQSDVKSPQFIRTRIDAFLMSMKEKLSHLSHEEFKQFIQAKKLEYTKRHLSLIDETDELWEELIRHQYYFNRSKIIFFYYLFEGDEYSKEIDTIQLEKYVEFANDLLFENTKRLEVHVISEQMEEENESLKIENKESIIYMDSIDAIKRQMPLYPDFFSMMR